MSTSQQSTSSVTGQIELQTQSIDGPVKVLVPVGWIKSPYTGGDFGGYKFVNPNDGNEQMLVVYSACAGCGYANGDPQHDKPDPVSLIAEDPVSKFTFNNGLSAGYTYYAEGDPYTGNGVVTVKPQGGGYAQVDIILPDSDKSIATKVLNSFQFFGF